MCRRGLVIVGIVIFHSVIEHLYQKNVKTGLSNQGNRLMQIFGQLLSFEKVKEQNNQDNEIADGINTGIAPEIIQRPAEVFVINGACVEQTADK